MIESTFGVLLNTFIFKYSTILYLSPIIILRMCELIISNKHNKEVVLPITQPKKMEKSTPKKIEENLPLEHIPAI